MSVARKTGGTIMICSDSANNLLYMGKAVERVFDNGMWSLTLPEEADASNDDALSIFCKYFGYPITYTVAFAPNGGAGFIAPFRAFVGDDVVLPANSFTRDGFTFSGWATSKANAKKGKVAYKNKQSVKNLVTSGKTIKLYAVWKK